jgi:phage terminase small subunit
MASPDSPEQSKLTAKQEAFVRAYVGTARFNASKAVLQAGYKTKNANDLGYQLRNTPHVRARIDEILDAETLTATEILHELTDVAMRDLDEEVEIRRFGKDDNGNPILSARMDARAKMEALKLLGQNKGMYTEKHEHDVKGLTFADLHAIAAADEGAGPVGPGQSS